MCNCRFGCERILEPGVEIIQYVIDVFTYWEFQCVFSERAEIGIGAGLAARPLPHHRAYGSVHGGSDRLPDLANRWKSKRSEVTI